MISAEYTRDPLDLGNDIVDAALDAPLPGGAGTFRQALLGLSEEGARAAMRVALEAAEIQALVKNFEVTPLQFRRQCTAESWLSLTASTGKIRESE